MRTQRAFAAISASVLAIAAVSFAVGVVMVTQPAKQAGASAKGPMSSPPVAPLSVATRYRILGWNDLGMHCMNESFANLAVLPPFNTVWAQVIQPGYTPRLITQSVSVEYSIVDNTYSAGKTDFWQYAPSLFGVSLPPDVGLTGARLSGTLHVNTSYFKVEGIPLTQYRDSAPTTPYPYQLAHLIARATTNGELLAETYAVAPVSTEMHCDYCHYDGGVEHISTGNVETNILTLHDMEELTQLMSNRPVLCASCHASAALGAPGQPDVPNLSRAMHKKHGELDSIRAPMSSASTAVDPQSCYNCHPGQQTQCLRDVMYASGMTCENCHGSMLQVASETRRPWIDEPRCGSCHAPQFAENPATLYRNSVGHGGLYCEACHGCPHAIFPTNQPNDNLQNIALQGHAGTLTDCRVCHTVIPQGAGPHGIQYHFVYMPGVLRSAAGDY